MKFPVVIVGNMVGFRKPIHKIVLWNLANHADNKTWKCNPSVARIAELSGIGERYAQKILKALEEDQYISRVGNSLGGNPGCTTIFLIHKGVAISKAIKSRSNKGNADSATLTPVLQNTPTPVLEHTPTGVLQGNNPCPTVRLTPVLQNTLTTNELYITTTKEEFNEIDGENRVAMPPHLKESHTSGESNLTNAMLEEKYGAYWYENAALVRKLIAYLGFPCKETENTYDIGKRIKGMLK